MEEPEKIVSQTELDDKAQKLVEDKDADSRLRVYIGPMEKALTAVLLIWAAFQVWANMFGTLGAVKLRTSCFCCRWPSRCIRRSKRNAAAAGSCRFGISP